VLKLRHANRRKGCQEAFVTKMGEAPPQYNRESGYCLILGLQGHRAYMRKNTSNDKSNFSGIEVF
jgi:hypothetical protein